MGVSDAIVIAFIFALGAVVGSFLNVVIYRVPAGKSLVKPGSECPSCGHDIRWYHNVPVFGWIVLGGKCADCGAGISIRYPAVEALTALLFVAVYVVHGPAPRTALLWVFVAALVAVAFIDLDHRIIPNKIVVPGALVGFLGAVAIEPRQWWVFLLAGLGASGFLLLLGLIWAGGMGMGDVKLALMMGVVLGSSVVVGMFVAFMLGGIGGGLLLATKRKKRRDRIPFGPFLAVGAGVAALVGPAMLEWYLGRLW